MGKLMADFSNLAMVSGLGRYARLGRLSAATLVLGLSLAACTITGVSDDPSDTPVLETGQVARPVSVAQSEISATSPGDAAVPQIGALDADAIVAAQEQVIGGIYESLVPSVVRIRSIRQLDQIGTLPVLPGSPEFERSSGTGFVWDDQGHIVTNHHVIEGANRVTVIFADDTELEARLLGSDPDSDLAVLLVEDGDHPMLPVSLGDSSAVRVGNIAVAIGNPFGQEFTITSGIISAVGRTIHSGYGDFSIPQVIQTDAPINPGNSGGPLLDRQGRVIGVNTQIISNNGASSGIGFAVPINAAKRVIPGLIEDGRYDYAWLGISGTTLTRDTAELNGLTRNTRGTLIIEVMPGSPADVGGLHGSTSTGTIDGEEYPVGGDVIVAINGRPIEEMDQLITYLIENARPGENVEIEFLRDGNPREKLTVTLGKRTDS
ncbi:MAG TPA: trypsin-like peptidase domain-containing protein [Dehalococcoidia bacterium]|nr:trypsin-like peptidase domain-containing protein [Dehalococcoidia bacterium]